MIRQLSTEAFTQRWIRPTTDEPNLVHLL